MELEDAIIYYSGSNNPSHRAGVAIIIAKSATKAVMEYVPLSERAMMIRLQTNYRLMNIIQSYAPTADKDDEEVERSMKILKHC